MTSTATLASELDTPESAALTAAHAGRQRTRKVAGVVLTRESFDAWAWAGWSFRFDGGDWWALPPVGRESERELLGSLRAAVAYAVYQPEQRHPVEVAADQQEHLVQWLSKRLARPLTVPGLQAQGFELVGGRLLPGEHGARAQFMYQNAAGQRITLYLGALDGAPLETFRFDQQGPVASFYWVERGFGYAITGELPRPALQALATVVYEQLQHAPAQPAGTQQIGRR